MELPVGSFTENLKEAPDTARVLLESNVKDEERHDLALGYVADVHGLDAEKEAILRDAWIAHPDHTILKALVENVLYSLLFYLSIAFVEMLL